MVNFEGQSVQELTEAFHEAVDDYLAYCEEEGIQPHKSYSGSLNVRLTPEIHSPYRNAGTACRYLYQCFHQTSTGEANYSYVIE